jgi:uncharacterized protein (DUF1810 family)
MGGRAMSSPAKPDVADTAPPAAAAAEDCKAAEQSSIEKAASEIAATAAEEGAAAAPAESPAGVCVASDDEAVSQKEDASQLNRFLEAQEADGSYAQALSELRDGAKTSHWIWWVLPQRRGLGFSWASNHYGIASDAEARAYLKHPVLSTRLFETVDVVHHWLVEEKRAPLKLMGSGIDVAKMYSSMDLFVSVGAKLKPQTPPLTRFIKLGQAILNLKRH